MNPKVNYLVVGIFVITLFCATAIFALWLAFGYGEAKQSTYLIDMNESVSGLSKDSVVKFNGVNVGSIQDISLGKDPSEVVIQIAVDDDTPITVDTRATLMSQGLTGISYINLSGGTSHSKKLQRGPNQKYPVIPTNRSLLLRLDSTIGKLERSLDQLSQSVNHLMSDENQKNVKEILDNMQKITKTVADHSEDVGQTLQEMPQMVLAAHQSLNTLNTQTLPSLGSSLMVLPGILTGFSHFVQEIAQDPSNLWRGNNSVDQLGPGEAKP